MGIGPAGGDNIAKYSTEYIEIVTVISEVAEISKSFYNLITYIYELGWGQSFHFSPSIRGTDRDSTSLHEDMAVNLILVSPDLGCGIGGPMQAITERFNGDDEDLVGAVEEPVGHPLFNVKDV
ncbi:hypothetical protein RHSIM_Rhsim05G0164000 [Rhododendron simsii]|uniref:Uncharacterized protein n=1 Tax=Rhododendron simsii TaxID=118357 RepID=A0A834LQX9_RHOSS|nr:hypothetical protein RHSIM_Rhsim05G0164000 [Rhododendron simsii]